MLCMLAAALSETNKSCIHLKKRWIGQRWETIRASHIRLALFPCFCRFSYRSAVLAPLQNRHLEAYCDSVSWGLYRFVFCWSMLITIDNSEMVPLRPAGSCDDMGLSAFWPVWDAKSVLIISNRATVQRLQMLCPLRTFYGNLSTECQGELPCLCTQVHHRVHQGGSFPMEVRADMCPPFSEEALWFRAPLQTAVHKMNRVLNLSFRHNSLYTQQSSCPALFSADLSTGQSDLQSCLLLLPSPSKHCIRPPWGSGGRVGSCARLLHRQSGPRTWPRKPPATTRQRLSMRLHSKTHTGEPKSRALSIQLRSKIYKPYCSTCCTMHVQHVHRGDLWDINHSRC